jgi:hypothetical protein
METRKLPKKLKVYVAEIIFLELPETYIEYSLTDKPDVEKKTIYTDKRETGWRHVAQRFSTFPNYRYQYLIRTRTFQVYRMGSHTPINWIK